MYPVCTHVPANLRLEPTRRQSRVIMSPWRAAQADRWADGIKLQLAEKAIVLSVIADPEPDDLIVL